MLSAVRRVLQLSFDNRVLRFGVEILIAMRRDLEFSFDSRASRFGVVSFWQQCVEFFNHTVHCYFYI